MKELKLTFGGKGYLAFISFFDKTVMEAIDQAGSDGIDPLDLIQENEKLNWVVATGLEFCECNLAVTIELDGKQTIQTTIVEIHEEHTDSEFEQEFGCSRDSVLVYDHSAMERPMEGSGFSERDDLCYAILEVVESDSSGGAVTFDVFDDFCLSDIQVVATDFDCESETNLEELIYLNLNGMEREIRAVRYKGELHRVGDLESITGRSYFYGFEKRENWVRSAVLDDFLF